MIILLKKLTKLISYFVFRINNKSYRREKDSFQRRVSQILFQCAFEQESSNAYRRFCNVRCRFYKNDKRYLWIFL